MEELRKFIQKTLTEALADQHYIDRLYDRFINADVLEVGFEITGSVGEYEIVGTYVLPATTKAEIVANVELIENYSFPKNKSFGIQIAQFNIDKNKVTYYSEELKNAAKSKTLLFVDKKTSSNGNLVYLIVRNNEITTVYLAKNYVAQDASKLKVDGIIKNMDVIRQRKVR